MRVELLEEEAFVDEVPLAAEEAVETDEADALLLLLDAFVGGAELEADDVTTAPEALLDFVGRGIFEADEDDATVTDETVADEEVAVLETG